MQYDERTTSPDLGTLGNALVEEALRLAYVWLPAEVTAYHPPAPHPSGRPTPAQVSLRVLLRRGRAIENEGDLEDGETLERGAERQEGGTPRADAFGGLLAISDYPTIPRAIVYRPGVGSTCRLRGPVPIGTVGIALVSSRMVDRWQTRSGVVDPEFPATGAHLHNLASCAFLPTLVPGPGEVVDEPGADAILGTDDTTARITWRGGGEISIETGVELRLGGNGAVLSVGRVGDPVSPNTTWVTFASQVAGYINGLVPGTVTVPSPTEVGVIAQGSTVVKSI